MLKKIWKIILNMTILIFIMNISILFGEKINLFEKIGRKAQIIRSLKKYRGIILNPENIDFESKLGAFLEKDSEKIICKDKNGNYIGEYETFFVEKIDFKNTETYNYFMKECSFEPYLEKFKSRNYFGEQEKNIKDILDKYSKEYDIIYYNSLAYIFDDKELVLVDNGVEIEEKNGFLHYGEHAQKEKDFKEKLFKSFKTPIKFEDIDWSKLVNENMFMPVFIINIDKKSEYREAYRKKELYIKLNEKLKPYYNSNKVKIVFSIYSSYLE
ncbi:hypothetical protein [Oceanivirga salmonicida]|uniref:hypothetical protein n=1 Tax=Oceanivirga salmonicida TaxID=1769291 RepID=UPI0012E12A3D|nr:hypothetical protein [Oceanivirga salmonicida]